MKSARHFFFFSILTILGFSQQVFREVPNIKFHGNPSSGSRTDTRAQTYVRTDMTKVDGALCNYVKVPKKRRSKRQFGTEETFFVVSS
jgi:hypothetical protein